MRGKARYLIALPILALLVVVAYTLREEPHKFTEYECMRCHMDVENDPSALVSPVETLCAKCHRKGLKAASHPINVRPEITRVPLDMPLSMGLLTCNTCHNVHADRFTGFGEKSYYLRRPYGGREFCISCHEDNPIPSGHKRTLDIAHMGRKFRVTDENQPLDGLSLGCIGCHDGTVAGNVDYVVGAGSWRHIEGSHPIGVDYNESRMKAGGLAPLSRVDKRIRLFDGRLGCGTCHDPYSGLPGQLVMENVKSRLCTQCHDDK